MKEQSWSLRNFSIRLSLLMLTFLMWSGLILADTKEIAITIDDLPFVGSANYDQKN